MKTNLLDLLAKYRKNQATPEEIAYIKEHLAEFQELQDLALEEEKIDWEELDLSLEDEQLKQKINRQIKKNYFKTILTTIGLLLVLLGVSVVVLPKLVDKFYYDPITEQGEKLSPFTLSLVVANELQQPYRSLNEIKIDALGFGNYDVYTKFTEVGQSNTNYVPPSKMQLRKGRILQVDTSTFRKTASLLRLPKQSSATAKEMFALQKEHMLQQLATLPPYSQIYASLAFEPNMDLAQVKKLEEEKNTHIYWYGVQPPNDQTSIMGFAAYGGVPYTLMFNNEAKNYLNQLNQTYPYLFIGIKNGEEYPENYQFLRFQSMLAFMLDHEADYQQLFHQEYLTKEIKAYQRLLKDEANFKISSIYMVTTVDSLKKILTEHPECFAKIQQIELYNQNF